MANETEKEGNPQLAMTQDELDSKQHFIYAEKADRYLQDIQSCEFMIQNKLTCIIKEIKFQQKSVTLKLPDEFTEKGLQILITQKNCEEPIYHREISGTSDEVRFHLIYFVYKDIMNTGLMFFMELFKEKQSLLKDYATQNKNKFEA